MVTDSYGSRGERTEGGRHHKLPRGNLISPQLNPWPTAAAKSQFAMVVWLSCGLVVAFFVPGKS